MLDLITQKEKYIRRVIACSNKEKQKLKAEQALEELTKILYNNLVSCVPNIKSAWYVKKQIAKTMDKTFKTLQ